MSITAGDVTTETQALLNDTAGAVFTFAALLPFLKKAYRELQLEIRANSGPPSKEIFPAVTVSAGAVVYPSQPATLLQPIWLGERDVGSTLDYEPMRERSWEPNEQKTEELRFWNWREEEIKFLGATRDRSVLLRGLKGFAMPTVTSSVLETGDDSQVFLAARTGSLASMYIGSNVERATALQEDAIKWLMTYIGTRVKRAQALPTRRRPWGSSFRRRGVF